VQIFTQFEDRSLKSISLQSLWDHSMAVGACSKAIAKAQKAEPLMVDDAFIAGLLHDIGKLILASNVPEEYLKIRELTRDGRMSFIDAEREIIGTTHAEVGAYLLCLWGFSDAIVEAVGFHHEPMVGLHAEFSPLTTTHVANMIVCEKNTPDDESQSEQVDEEYLSALGLAGRLDSWREIVLTIMGLDGETS
jgi:putative nucleotidyltransferase with HDIG domain